MTGNIGLTHSPEAADKLRTAQADTGLAQDYTDSVVPLSERRSNFRMFLTFLSMQATFGAVYVGYTARFEGLSFTQLIAAMAIATVAMSLYCIGSANAGATVGQTTSVMTRGIFGKLGSRFVSVLLMINGMGFYVFTVLFVMSLLGGLFTMPAVKALTVGLAFLMITNTYFGFGGVQRFAQYVAVPVVMIWGFYATIRGITTVSGHQLHSHVHVTAPSSVLFVTGAMVGLSTWGNEADIFRYARTRPQWNLPTIIISYAVGSFMFPIMGYIVAALSNTADFGASIKYFVNFSLFGLVALGFVFFIVNQTAVNDGNLYIAVNGVQNLTSDLTRWRRKYTVLGLGAIAGGLTLVLPSLQQTFNIVTGIGAVTVPTASTVMAVDVLVLPRMFGIRRPLDRVAHWQNASWANWPGILAVVAGTVVGAVTGGLVPGTVGFQKTYIGFPAVQAWLTGAVVYLVGVALVHKRANARALLGFPQFAAARTPEDDESHGRNPVTELPRASTPHS
jgi:purine-cytosine permease-like protein